MNNLALVAKLHAMVDGVREGHEINLLLLDDAAAAIRELVADLERCKAALRSILNVAEPWSNNPRSQKEGDWASADTKLTYIEAEARALLAELDKE